MPEGAWQELVGPMSKNGREMREILPKGPSDEAFHQALDRGDRILCSCYLRSRDGHMVRGWPLVGEH
jgi:hypothetical protein